ncbi:hypothetical protein Tco_0010622 [Tanacetum coccineum]
MLYTVQGVFFRRHQGHGLDDLARTFSSLLLADCNKSNLYPFKQIKVRMKVSLASALQVLRRLESIFTSVYATVQKLKKKLKRDVSVLEGLQENKFEGDNTPIVIQPPCYSPSKGFRQACWFGQMLVGAHVGIRMKEVSFVMGSFVKFEVEKDNKILSLCFKGLIGNEEIMFESLNDHIKGVQSGMSMCFAKMVEIPADNLLVFAFQKMCGMICKYLNNPGYLAKAHLLDVTSCLLQIDFI